MSVPGVEGFLQSIQLSPHIVPGDLTLELPKFGFKVGTAIVALGGLLSLLFRI